MEDDDVIGQIVSHEYQKQHEHHAHVLAASPFFKRRIQSKNYEYKCIVHMQNIYGYVYIDI